MKLEGKEALLRKLRDMPNNLARKHLRKAARAGGEVIAERAGDIAPRAPGAPDLAENITVSEVRTDDTLSVAVAIGPARGFFYGGFQEFGTKNHGAQPFMRPAFDSEQQHALEEAGKVIWEGLSEDAR